MMKERIRSIQVLGRWTEKVSNLSILGIFWNSMNNFVVADATLVNASLVNSSEAELFSRGIYSNLTSSFCQYLQLVFQLGKFYEHFEFKYFILY